MKRRNYIAMALRSPRFAPKKIKSRKAYDRKAAKAATRKEIA